MTVYKVVRQSGRRKLVSAFADRSPVCREYQDSGGRKKVVDFSLAFKTKEAAFRYVGGFPLPIYKAECTSCKPVFSLLSLLDLTEERVKSLVEGKLILGLRTYPAPKGTVLCKNLKIKRRIYK